MSDNTTHSMHNEKEKPAITKPTIADDVNVFHLENVIKRRSGGNGFVLTVPELIINRGEKLALVGFSGCGKSTLLDLLAMVLRPDDATVFTFAPVADNRLDILDSWEKKDLNALARSRMLYMGYVLQTGGLFPFLSIRDNIGLCRQGLGIPLQDSVETVAGRLGIDRHLDKLPGQLSVGERQRVAIARAMAHEPAVVIADEPTASLDPINAEEIMALFAELADAFHVTLIVATHDWRSVSEYNFRRVEFVLNQDKREGTVQATVCS